MHATMLSQVKYFDGKELRTMANDIAKANSEDILEVIVGQMQNEYDIRGVNAGLRSNKSRLIELKIHKMFGHLGFCPGCSVCHLAKRFVKENSNYGGSTSRNEAGAHMVHGHSYVVS